MMYVKALKVLLLLLLLLLQFLLLLCKQITYILSMLEESTNCMSVHCGKARFFGIYCFLSLVFLWTLISVRFAEEMTWKVCQKIEKKIWRIIFLCFFYISNYKGNNGAAQLPNGVLISKKKQKNHGGNKDTLLEFQYLNQEPRDGLICTLF